MSYTAECDFEYSPRIKNVSPKISSRIGFLNFFCTLESFGYSHLILLFQLRKIPVVRLFFPPIKSEPLELGLGHRYILTLQVIHVKLSCGQVV